MVWPIFFVSNLSAWRQASDMEPVVLLGGKRIPSVTCVLNYSTIATTQVSVAVSQRSTSGTGKTVSYSVGMKSKEIKNELLQDFRHCRIWASYPCSDRVEESHFLEKAL